MGNGRIVAVSGTRHRNSDEQRAWVRQMLTDGPWTELRHGACVGADETTHHLAVERGMQVVIHPPTDTKHMMALPEPSDTITIMPAKPYIPRNHDLTDPAEVLLALPNGSEEDNPRSGTWATVRYALDNRKPVAICYPNGDIEFREPERRSA